ncbi:hypothetical protein [Pseudodesulfovibrio sp. zrk46]|uniref:hypothetical protein n=1 Tax=Pseudodesulfovibrio sp. zrk46 TaxID=2725288 RepID=UPI001449E939|nr:hypothetical protein [Pseudodesulfovibrio sp. zrk46]QJB55668.1 hypothetical protein HFN16_04310 [Pseudodesulfovibrio sp. zrk46]
MSLAFLPGCAVVGPLLSVGGMAGLAPLQYASTVYTVGEFSYEYAVNENDPGEVIQAKIDSVLSGEAFMLPDYIPGAKQLNNGGTMVAEADTTQTESGIEADTSVAPALSAEARQKRIQQILGQRTAQFERLELRRMAFLKAQNNGNLSLRQTAMASKPDLFQGAVDETRLR